MTTTREITNEVQEKVLESVRVGQRAVVDSVRSWATTLETVFSRLPELSFTDTSAKPTEVLESSFSFTERLLSAQRDFAAQLFEASLPATRVASAGAQAAKAASAKV